MVLDTSYYSFLPIFHTFDEKGKNQYTISLGSCLDGSKKGKLHKKISNYIALKGTLLK